MKPTRIILHHSLTKDSGTVSWGAIREYHTKINHYHDIGYHFGIENLRGQTEVLIGRLPNEKGAHCQGNNSDSLGICFVGNFDLGPVPAESWDAGIRLVKYLMKQFSIQTVQGHCEINPAKSCPGKFFNVDAFRFDVGL